MSFQNLKNKVTLSIVNRKSFHLLAYFVDDNKWFKDGVGEKKEIN